MSTRSARTVLLITGAALGLVAACSSSGSSSSSSNTASAPGGAVVSMSGSVLVGPDGHTVYENTVDTATSIKCTGTCQALWPPVPGPATAGSGVSAGELGTITRPDGSKQATLDGHPLYEFGGDKAAGDKSGEGVSDGGGVWHAATTSGGPVTSTPSAGSSSSSAGGYTY